MLFLNINNKINFKHFLLLHFNLGCPFGKKPEITVPRNEEKVSKD